MRTTTALRTLMGFVRKSGWLSKNLRPLWAGVIYRKGSNKMHKPNIKAAYNAVKKSTIKHSPEILTGIGIAGMVTTTVMAVRATPKALDLLEKEEYFLDLLSKS